MAFFTLRDPSPIHFESLQVPIPSGYGHHEPIGDGAGRDAFRNIKLNVSRGIENKRESKLIKVRMQKQTHSNKINRYCIKMD
jgi:hypothetical protein